MLIVLEERSSSNGNICQTTHLVSCAYNSIMLGEIAVVDWDMFHSRHPYAHMHAAARAISGTSSFNTS